MLKITDIKEAPEAATSHGATNKTDTAYTETENKSMVFCDGEHRKILEQP